eukprot:TRINITY_DN101750_c0_g1_i1.p1 TRINITY_DN101750_c0_g1~~TRINITY_DN101750_c0_g1_i1.p1  ORF type:complete len:269 (+),score=73.44 TRINITY_DN101750_c0_g1_i1:50-808(+)
MASLKRPAPTADEDGEPEEKQPRRTGDWRDFVASDPLYAVKGEATQDRVCDEDGSVKEATLRRYLEILLVQKAIKKPKDWVEVWAAMNIPIESQSKVLLEILRFGLENACEGLGDMLSELIKGHRVKTKAVEEAALEIMKGVEDRSGVLRQMLFNIFPKSPNSEWGWSRVGWSWLQWWQILEKLLGVLEPTSAFDELASLLNEIEAAGGKPLTQQTLVWQKDRLAKAKALLCKFGSLEDENDLTACLDATLI